MRRQGQGLSDKLYWRSFQLDRNFLRSARWHCFKKTSLGRRKHEFRSLCGTFALSYSGGQAITRPASWQRCAICDGREADRRGWKECAP